MSDQNLMNTLKALNYDNATIKKIMAAADSAELECIRATRGDMTELTPIKAAAISSRHRRILDQTLGLIRHLSAQTYDLPLDKPVSLPALNAALRNGNGSPTDRMAIKANLASLGLC